MTRSSSKLNLFTATAFAAVLIFGVASPAFAHDELASSNPENGSLVATAPETVSVTFAENVLEMGTAIAVLDPNGTDWVAGPVVIDGGLVTAPLKPEMPSGVYTIDWRVVSTDGHPVLGAIVFGVGAGAEIESELAIATAAVAPVDPSESIETVEAIDPQAEALMATTGAADPGPSPAMLLIGGGVAAVLLVLGVLVVRRSRAARSER